MNLDNPTLYMKSQEVTDLLDSLKTGAEQAFKPILIGKIKVAIKPIKRKPKK